MQKQNGRKTEGRFKAFLCEVKAMVITLLVFVVGFTAFFLYSQFIRTPEDSKNVLDNSYAELSEPCLSAFKQSLDIPVLLKANEPLDADEVSSDKEADESFDETDVSSVEENDESIDEFDVSFDEEDDESIDESDVSSDEKDEESIDESDVSSVEDNESFDEDNVSSDEDVESLNEDNVSFDEDIESLDEADEDSSDEEDVKQNLEEKLSSYYIYDGMDMSVPLGLTSDELSYLIHNSGLISNEEILSRLPEIMVETVEQYPVNELFSLSVMSLESGYFSSELAQNKNNFGGMLNSDGSGIYFDTVDEGLQKAIMCVHSNLKGSNTIYEIQDTYCPPGNNGYEWSSLVLSIMQSYAYTEVS